MAQIYQRLPLQIVIGLLALVPIFLGLHGVFSGPEMLEVDGKRPVLLNSHIRYLSGILFAMGMLLLRSLPTIDRDGTDLRRITLLAFIGALGRLWGLVTVAFSFSALMFTLFEMFVPLLVSVWQYRVQHTTKRSRTK